MTAIAFLGLGAMGVPMAERLIEAGEEVTVWNRTPERAERFAGRARVAATPAEAAAGADAVVTMLAAPDAVEAVVLDQGTAAAMRPGATLVEMSTIGPDALAGLASELPDGIELIDAPVLGSVPNATDGTLKVMVGASDEQFERWQPTLSALGTPIHVGPRGAGAAMKLVVNSTLAGQIAVLGEALLLADRLGLEQEPVAEVLLGSPIGPALSRKLDAVRSGSFPPSFKLELMSKDVRLFLDAAEKRGVDPRVAVAVAAWLDDAESEGMGALDYSALIAAIRGTPAEG